MIKQRIKNKLKILLSITILAVCTSAGADEVKIDVKGGGLKVKQGDNKFEIGGALMWDFDRYDGVHRQMTERDNSWINHSELRRARIGFKGSIGKIWQASLQLDFDDTSDTVDVDDAVVVYSGWDMASIHVGQTKEPFGLENLTSSKYTTFIERSMATNGLTPDRHPGIGLSGDVEKKFTWAVGVYEAANSVTEGGLYAVTGRVTYAPWLEEHSFLHLGVAGSVRDLDGEMVAIDEAAEVHTAREFIDSAETQADTLNLLGLELALGLGPFSLQAEYMLEDVNAQAGDDATYYGYYVQASYFLTGESRPYKKGIFGKVKPDRKSGALELAARYSFLDASDNQLGVAAANTVLGATYYFNPQVRLMGNYIHTRLTEDNESEKDDTGNALSLRAQFIF